jgi:hypothetical protein
MIYINKVNNNVQFHFLNHIDVNSNRGKKILSKLNTSTIVWLENVDFYEFIKISELVIDFTNDSTTLINEVMSYGIKIMQLKRGKENNVSEFYRLLRDKSKKIIPTNNNYFSRDYRNYYLSIRSRQ